MALWALLAADSRWHALRNLRLDATRCGKRAAAVRKGLVYHAAISAVVANVCTTCLRRSQQRQQRDRDGNRLLQPPPRGPSHPVSISPEEQRVRDDLRDVKEALRRLRTSC
jgi:hypothetical protein